MCRERSTYLFLFTLISSMFVLDGKELRAQERHSERERKPYSWMLPKTVFDVNIVYTLKDCSNIDTGGVRLSFEVIPTLSPRAVPDLVVGLLEINPDRIGNLLQDKFISITTSGNSHNLATLGAKPADQTAAIIGNILGGVTKLAGIAFGVAIPQAEGAPPKAQKVTCGPAKAIVDMVESYRKRIKGLEDDLKKPDLDEVTFKKDVAIIQEYQTFLTSEEQSKLSLTIKGTIDPGWDFTPSDKVEDPHNKKPKDIPADGLIASIAPTSEELVQKEWIAPQKELALADITANMNLLDTKSNPLQINVYMDFENAVSKAVAEEHADEHVQVLAEQRKRPALLAQPKPTLPNTYPQTFVYKPNWECPERWERKDCNSDAGSTLYREAKYIPVLVWRGDKPKDNKDATTGNLDGPKQLAAPKTWPFAQYGFNERLPLSANLFDHLEWALIFSEFGEITSATFTKASWLLSATSLFSSAASAAGSIAGEQQKAAAASSPSAQAAAIQAKADEIYERQRLALCEARPASCPSK
jgi:hypothetical protein